MWATISGNKARTIRERLRVHGWSADMAVWMAPNREKEQCKHGHFLSGENLYITPKDGRRACRTCRCKRNAEYRKNEKNHERALHRDDGKRTETPSGMSQTEQYADQKTIMGSKTTQKRVVRDQ